MIKRFSFLWEALRSSLWFVPSLIVLFSVVAAVTLIEADGWISHELSKEWPRLFGAGADGSRGMLQAIAGSMITVAGVTFSITIVSLSLASSQYTPRILRNFMSDLPNQVVLGSFVGIFTYCLIVMRTIHGDEDDRFIPALAVAFAALLAVVGIGLLIYFIHHTAQSIQASSIIAAAADETIASVDRLFPEELGEGADEENANGEPDETDEGEGLTGAGRWNEIASPSTGYVQGINDEEMLVLADELGTVLRMECGVGDFVIEGGTLLSVALEEMPDEKTVSRLHAAYTISRFRTVVQDASFGVRQLVDIALKALSSGINDTTTAVMCVDYLSAICARVAGRRIPDPRRYSDGHLRIIARGPTFESLLDDSFDQLRESSAGNTAVILRVFAALETIARRTAGPLRLFHISAHAARWRSLAERSIESEHDRVRIERAAAKLTRVIGDRERARSPVAFVGARDGDGRAQPDELNTGR